MIDVDLRRPPQGGAAVKRSTDFPACACDSLRLVDKTLKYGSHQPNSSVGTGRGLSELQASLDQDLFCLTPDRRLTRLSAIQELKLLDVLCSYFQEKASIENVRQRYACFELIFLGREGETTLHEARVSLLTKLCSLAVQYPCHSLLADVATWFLNVGLGKPHAKNIIDKLLEDFCMSSESTDLIVTMDIYLLPLIHGCPEFACFLLILGWAGGAQGSERGLLQVTAEWLNGSADKFLAVLKNIEKTSVGVALIAALCNEVFPKLVSRVCCGGGGTAGTLAKLHTGLLRLMLAVADSSLDNALLLVVDREIVDVLDAIATSATGGVSASGSPPPQPSSVAVDRIAQLIQIAVSTRCFAGSKERIRKKCLQLHISHPLLDHALL